MLLDVDEQVFGTDDHRPVLTLLNMIVEGRHDWYPTPAAVLAAEDFVTTNTPHTTDYRELLITATAAMAYPPPEEPNVRITLDQLRDLVADLSQAAIVLVENSTSDGSFVRALLTTLGGEPVVTALRNHWLIIEHAGGSGEFDRRTTELCARFRLLARVVVLLDSDRDSPGQSTTSHDKQALLMKKERLADVHVWERREIENYIPVAVWRHHFPKRARKVDTLTVLLPRQRGYLDFKKGGWNDSEIQAEVPPEVARLWSSGLPSRAPLVPEDVPLTRADFEELGQEAMAELERFLAMVEKIR